MRRPGAASRPDRVFERGPPYNVTKYINLKQSHTGRPYLDSQRYAVLLSYRDHPNLPRGFAYTDVDKTWAARWRHTGGRIAPAPDSITDGPFDSPYIRCHEEVPYVKALKSHVEELLSDESACQRQNMNRTPTTRRDCDRQMEFSGPGITWSSSKCCTRTASSTTPASHSTGCKTMKSTRP